MCISTRADRPATQCPAFTGTLRNTAVRLLQFRYKPLRYNSLRYNSPRYTSIPFTLPPLFNRREFVVSILHKFLKLWGPFSQKLTGRFFRALFGLQDEGDASSRDALRPPSFRSSTLRYLKITCWISYIKISNLKISFFSSFELWGSDKVWLERCVGLVRWSLGWSASCGCVLGRDFAMSKKEPSNSARVQAGEFSRSFEEPRMCWTHRYPLEVSTRGLTFLQSRPKCVRIKQTFLHSNFLIKNLDKFMNYAS